MIVIKSGGKMLAAIKNRGKVLAVLKSGGKMLLVIKSGGKMLVAMKSGGKTYLSPRWRTNAVPTQHTKRAERRALRIWVDQ